MLPKQLLLAAERGRLMVLAGAGISKEAPSNLPDWWGFNRALLDEILALAREAVPNASDALATLQNAHIPVTAFSETIVSAFAGDSYFPVLRALESHAPNRNHDALAELARRGKLAAIFTTNFDTLIEQAFRARGVELRLFVERSDFTDIMVAPPCALFKIHGSVKQTWTLIDTVSQKLRGLPIWVRYALSGLDPSYPLMVMGFSGSDLEFGVDYLPLLANGRFVTWIVHPDREPSAVVTTKLQEIGGVIVKATLPEVFAELGIELPPVPDGVAVDPDASMRQLVREWLHLPHIGIWTCAAFCAELLADLGHHDAAQALARELTTWFSNQNEIPLTASKVCRVLGRLATQVRDFDAAEQWYRSELAVHEALRRMLVDAGGTPTPEGQREYLTNTASAIVNCAVVHRAKGELSESEKLLHAALPRAVEAASPYLLSRIEINLAHLAETGEAPYDEVLEHARASAEHANAIGHTQAIIEAYLAAARPLLWMGEYHSAQRELDGAASLLGISTQLAYAIECGRLRGELAARRGDDEEAIRVFTAVLERCTTDVQRRAVTITAVEALAHSEAGRAWLVTVDPEAATLLRDAPEGPVFLFRIDERMARPDLRVALALCEQRKDAVGRAQILALLLRELATYLRPQRMRDLAEALLDAARAVGDRPLECEAWNGIGVALDNLGRLKEAADAYRHAIDVAPTEVDVARARMNLAMILSRTQPPDAAESLFAQARAGLEESHADDRTRLFLNWARHRARHRAEGALELGLVARDAAQGVKNPDAVATCDAFIDEIRMTMTNDPLALPADASAPDLANTGLEELERGNVAAARALIERAKAIYERTNFEPGISRCLNNLADCADAEKKPDEAIALTTQALEIRRRIGDVHGEALTRAALAMRIMPKDPEQAFGHAERALMLLKGQPVDRTKAMAAAALALGHLHLGRELEARQTARDAAAWIIASDERSLQPLLEMLEPLLNEQPPRRAAAASARMSASPVVEMTLEAQRLNRSGAFETALDLLARAEAHVDSTDRDRAVIAGDRANVLQNAGRNLEAAAEYERAARELRKSDRIPLAQQAICQGAVSLRRAGELAKSEQWLRALLAEPLDTDMAAQACMALAKTLTQSFAEGRETCDASDRRFTEAEHLVDTTLAAKLGDDNLAHALLTKAQLHILVGRDDQADADLEKARTAFLRINSPYVALIDQQLADLRSRSTKKG